MKCPNCKKDMLPVWVGQTEKGIELIACSRCGVVFVEVRLSLFVFASKETEVTK